MYNELYAAWRREIEEASLGGLPSDFYTRVSAYLKRIRDEGNLIDKKSVKMSLLDREAQNVRRMLEELLWARYRKLIQTITEDQKLPSQLLSAEEGKMCETFVTFTAAYQKFIQDLLQGQSIEPAAQTAKTEAEPVHKRVTLRFTKSTPAMVGLDMKTYGPFMAEDVASLPVENARILVKRGLAVLVEVS